MRRALVLVALVSVSLAACSSSAKSGKPASSTTTSAVVTTTTVPLTTSSAAATTIPPAPSTTLATAVKESAFVDSVDVAAHTITIDPMEFLTGQAATTEYHKANPGATGGPPNDYFIVNPTKDHVVLPLEPTAPVQLVLVNGVAQNPPVNATQAELATYSGLARAPFWITIERGQVAAVIEQFVP